MEQKENNCCENKNKNRGIFSGIALGILPHSFCIAFIVFSIAGAITATSFLKKFMLIPNLFFLLVVVSLVLATISSVIYLKRKKCLCSSGIKSRWKYLTTLYSTTLLVNLLIFFVIFPALANVNFQKTQKETQGVIGKESNSSELSISVEIPCSGHATLITDEIKKNCDVESVAFSVPNKFIVKYDPEKTTPEKIMSLDIFKTYPAKII